MINIKSQNHIISTVQAGNLPPVYTPSCAETQPNGLLPPSYSELKLSPFSQNVQSTYTFSKNNTKNKWGVPSKNSSYKGNAASTKSAPILSIELLENRAYDLNDTISGHLVFQPRHDCRLTAVHVTLAGEERTVKRKSWITQTLLQHHHRLAKQPLDFNNTKLYKRGERYRFQFRICVPITGTSSDQPLLLPPTVGPSPDTTQQAAEYPVSVFYFVNAAIHIADETKSSGKSKIFNCESPRIVNIQPSYTTQMLVNTTLAKFVRGPLPSVTVETSKSSSAIIKPLSGLLKSSGTANPESSMLTVAATQPCLVLSRNQSDVIYLRLNMHYNNKNGGNSVAENAPKLLEVQAHLSAITTYTTPSSSKSTTDIRATRRETHIEKVQLEQYSSVAPQWRDGVAATSTANSELEIPLSLPFNKEVVCNFQSFYVARRYKLTLELQFVGGTRVDLDLPVCVTSSLYI